MAHSNKLLLTLTVGLIIAYPNKSFAFWSEFVAKATGVIKQGQQAQIWVHQYEELKDIKELSKKSDAELKKMHETQKKSEKHNKDILKLLDDYINKSDYLHKLATDKYTQNNFLNRKIDVLFGAGSSNLGRRIVDGYVNHGNINIGDLRELYNIVILDDKEKLILQLKDNGLSNAQIASITNTDIETQHRKRLENDLINIQKNILDQELLVATLEKEHIELYNSYNNEKDPIKKEKKLSAVIDIRQKKINAESNLRKLKNEAFSVSNQLQQIETRYMISLLEIRDRVQHISKEYKFQKKMKEYREHSKQNGQNYANQFVALLKSWVM